MCSVALLVYHVVLCCVCCESRNKHLATQSEAVKERESIAHGFKTVLGTSDE